MLNTPPRHRQNGKHSRIITILSAMIVLFGLPLLFVRQFGQSADSLILNELWNAGHIPLFFSAAWLWLASRAACQGGHKRHAAQTLIAGTALGLLIEYIQLWTGGDFSLLDALRDTCGILLALAFDPGNRERVPPSRRNLFRLSAAMLTTWVLVPLWMAITDRIILEYQFPVLSDFETPLEFIRWDVNTTARIVKNEKSNVLAVNMQPRLGTNKMKLRHFYRDWSERQVLSFKIKNADEANHTVTVRIHDQIHARGSQNYADRFNRRFDLDPGWNTIVIAMHDLQQAPTDRRMDLRKIVSLEISTDDLQDKWTAYLDNIKLIGETGELR